MFFNKVGKLSTTCFVYDIAIKGLLGRIVSSVISIVTVRV